MPMVETDHRRSRNRQSALQLVQPAVGMMGRLVLLMAFAMVMVRIAAMLFHSA